MPPALETATVLSEDVDSLLAYEDLWAVIVWNDDVNTFDHVIAAFVEILGHSPKRAEQLALRIHEHGKAVAAVRPKEEATTAVVRLHRRAIQATLDRA